MDQVACDREDGSCPNSLCAQGYISIFCDIACPDGFYGFACMEICGFCKDEVPCNKANGICPDNLCAAGYSTPKCDIGCPPRKYGDACVYTCGSCMNNVVCNLIDGSCPKSLCSPGYYNSRLCQTACPDGWYGVNCSHPCGHCKDSAACDKIDGTCPDNICDFGYLTRWCNIECPDGTYGLGCDKFCGHCKNGVPCKKSDGSCPDGLCDSGFITELCQTECPTGFFGDKCAQTCGFCREGFICNKASGFCLSEGCQPGYYSSKLCNSECVGTYGHNCFFTCGHCKGGAKCNNVDGTCPLGCDSGYLSLRCDAACPEGFYGNHCGLKCRPCKNNLTCNIADGSCPGNECIPGYHGLLCDQECLDGFYGDACKFTCAHCFGKAICNKADGTCPDLRCDAGYSGPRCDTDCDDGTYGLACTGRCGQCYNGTLCYKQNGTCPNSLCYPGFQPPFCDIGCENGFYGDKCVHMCGFCKGRAACNPVNGTCPKGLCEPGFITAFCNVECPAGMYGDKCLSICGFCMNENICNPADGTCPGHLCAKGYYHNMFCKTVCSDGWYGDGCSKKCGYCKNLAPCDRLTGDCPDGACDPGYQPVQCNKECFAGFYGDVCNRTCGHCLEGAVCNFVDGTCPKGFCDPGYSGNDCHTDCPDGTYGHFCATSCGYCKNGATCNKINGTCPDNLCEPGYRTTLCNVECHDGYYGEACRYICANCRNETACIKSDGTCPNFLCAPGYLGTKCDKECDNGFYGESCAEYCGNCQKGVACHILDGACPFGLCAPGYHGLRCNTECPDGYHGPNCVHMCGRCAYLTVCDKKSGSCPHGCQGGWSGEACDEEDQYWIQCITNCFIEKDPSQPVGFSVQFRDPFAQIASYRWILTSCDDKHLDCTNTLYDNSDKRVLVYTGLEEGQNYDVEAWIFFHDKKPEYLFQYFKTTLLPIMGTCIITPDTGFNLLTEFEISCAGFSDPEGRNLTYALHILDHETASDDVLNSKMNPDLTFFTLHQNYIGNDSMIDVVVKVSNQYKASVSWKGSVKIIYQNIPQMTENAFFSGIEGKLDILDKELKRLTSENSTADVAKILPEVNQLLMKTEVEIGLDSRHMKVNQVKERAMTLLENMHTEDILTLIQQAEVTNNIIEASGQVTTVIQDGAESVFAKIGRKFSGNWYKATSQQAETLSSLLVHGLGVLITAENDRDIKGQTAIEKNQKVTKMLHQVDSMVDVLLDYQVPQQPPLTLNTKSLSVTVMKGLPHELENLIVTSNFIVEGKTVAGNINLPMDMSSLRNSTLNADIELKMLLFAESPLRGGKDSEEITSAVLGLSLKDREGNMLRLEGESQTIDVEIPNSADFNLVSKNVTFSLKRKGDKMALSQSSDNIKFFTSTRVLDEAFILRLTPTNSSAKMKILITNKGYPTLSDVLQKGQTIPLPEDQLARKNYLVQDSYSVFFPANNVPQSNKISRRSLDVGSVTRGSEVLFVGVTLDPGSMNDSGLIDDKCIQGTCAMTISFGIDIETIMPTCNQWDEVGQIWFSDDCKVLPFTTRSKLHCTCVVDSLNNMFAGSVVPLAIKWIESEELFEVINHVVIAAVILLWITYLILLPWSKAAEESHKNELGVLVCSDNNPRHQYMYMVCVVTGWWMGAGTTAKVYLHLTGSEGSSRQFCMSHTRRKCFQTGGEDWIIITTDKSLGELQSLTVCHDNTGTSPDWLLDYIVVQDLIHQKSWIFLHRNWLAMHKDVCLTTSATLVASSMKNSKSYVKQNFLLSFYHELRNKHMWISIFFKTPTFPATFMELLSCAFSVILCVMLTTMLLIGVTDVSEPNQIETLFTSSSLVILVGIISSLLTSPINIFIVQLFVKRVTSIQVGHTYLPNMPLWIGEDDEDYLYMDSVIRTHRMSTMRLKALRVKRQKENADRKHTERIERSRWMHLGWLLSHGTLLAATCLVLHFGWTFSLASSGDWILSILVSLVHSALVVEPLRILILVLINTVYLKKPVHMEKYRFTSLQETDEEYVHEVNARKTKCSQPKYIPPSGTFLAHIRKKFESQWMINSALQDIVHYILFFAVVLIFAHANWKIQDSFACTKTVEQLFVKSTKEHKDFSKVKDVGSMFQHLEEVILPTLESLQDPKSTQTSSFYLVGSPRLRQLRINQALCPSVMNPSLYKISHPGCAKDDSALEDKGRYAGTWLTPIDASRTPLSSVWIYQSSADLHTPQFWGNQGSYSGGGFVLEMPSGLTKQIQEVEKIRNSVWIDNRTRGVFFEFSLYNPNVDMFTLIVLLFEFSNFGSVFPFQEITTVKLLRLSVHQVFMALCEISIFCFALAFSRIEIQKCRKFGAKKYFTNTWNIFEILHILLSYIVSVLFIQQLVCTISVTSKGFGQTKFVNLYCVAFWDSVIQYTVAFLIFMLIIKSVKFLSTGRFPIFRKVFSKAKTQLFFLCIFSMVYFLSFTLSAVLAFGKQSENFKDVVTGFLSHLYVWHEMTDICEISVLLPILYSLFIIFVFGIFCPMSFAILNHSLHLAKQTARERHPHFSIINYIKKKWTEKLLLWAGQSGKKE